MKLSRKTGPEPEQVQQSFSKLIQRGYIREFASLSAEDQKEVDSQLVHCYLPVVIAYKEAKGHEARPCLGGGSSLRETKSLNDLLPKGSSRFSMYKISQNWKVEMVGLCADISRFYNSFSLQKSQWSLQRLLWTENLDPEEKPTEFIITSLMY